jgi:hypothetical protein
VVYEKSRIPGYDPHVAYVAHIIGFLTGLPFGIALSDHWKRNLLIILRLLGISLAIVSGAARSFFSIMRVMAFTRLNFVWMGVHANWEQTHLKMDTMN